MAIKDSDFAALKARVDALEARQRLQRTHDTTCNFTQWQMGQPRTDPSLPKRACNCWLSK